MISESDLGRRNFLKTAGLISAASLPLQAARAEKPKSAENPKNLIFLVADGMGTGTLSAAHFWKQHTEGVDSEWIKLYSDKTVTRSFQDTASASSFINDSAAAGSAWGCGYRVNNGTINITPDGKKPTPLFVHAKNAGKATGLVSTCSITHATPAAFAVNMESRNAEEAIADQYLEREMDVYLGGGLSSFHREDSNIIPEFEKKGYAYAEDRKSLKKAAKKDRMLGLFSEGHLPYVIDRVNDPAFKGMPNLEEMFEASLDVLSRNPNGFVLQVEAGRVDHAGHENDPATIVYEQLEFDRCIKVARNFMKKSPDTLLVVTTDHGCGGCQFTGARGMGISLPEALDNIAKFKGSFSSMGAKFKETGKFDPETFEKLTTIKASAEKAAKVEALVPEYKGWFSAVVGHVFADELAQLTGFGWSSHNHTAEHVESVAVGPGSEAFPAFYNNDEMFGILREVLKV